MKQFRQALAADIDVLVRLHDRELDAACLSALRDEGFPATMNLLPNGENGERALPAMSAALAELASAESDAGGALASRLQLLSADFAAIYLNNAFGASPYESVWLHDEHLACQQPMFELRDLYAQAGLRVDDWRKRYDDHLVLQLQYLAHRLRADQDVVSLAGLGAFLDEHLGYWLPDFAARVASRCDSPFYAALAALTASWVERLRSVIEEISGEPRLPRETVAQRIRQKFSVATAGVAPIKFMPGAAGPSW